MHADVSLPVEVLHEIALSAEMAAYDQPGYTLPGRLRLPLPDEPHIAAWSQYIAQAAQDGAWVVLQQRLPQLQFPIAEQMSQHPDYLAATRRGVRPTGKLELLLEQPEKLEIFLYGDLAGRIPVIFTPVKSDFRQLVRAIRHKNEPVPLPESIGAMLISGYNNWDRLWAYRQKWQESLPEPASEAQWVAEFGRLTRQPELYRDNFILMSQGNYSNLPAQALGLEATAWEQQSLSIRLVHEYTHYLTRRVFGHLRTHALDELLADYAGLVSTYGCFQLTYFFQFMGLEAYPHFRENGRLAYYRKQLSDAAFATLQTSLVQAAERLAALKTEAVEHTLAWETAVIVLAALSLPLPVLAGPNGGVVLGKAKEEIVELLGGTDEQSYLSQISTGANSFTRAA